MRLKISNYKKNSDKKIPSANEEITASEVRLVDENGEMLGIMNIKKALEEAQKRNLDLVEMSPNAAPPVCKILDLGKHKYEMKKKAQAAKKKQKTIEIKEIKIRPNIAEHDYQTKFRNLTRFINEGNKVKVSLRFKGREITHQEVALQLFSRIIEETKEFAKIEFEPKLEGKQIIMVLNPLK